MQKSLYFAALGALGADLKITVGFLILRSASDPDAGAQMAKTFVLAMGTPTYLKYEIDLEGSQMKNSFPAEKLI